MRSFKKQELLDMENQSLDLMENFYQYVEDLNRNNQEVEERLLDTDGKVPEVPSRKDYSEERKQAKTNFAYDKKNMARHRSAQEIRQERTRRANVKTESANESFYEKREVRLSDWIRGQYSIIHGNESMQNSELLGMFPNTTEGKKKNEVRVRGGVQNDSIMQKVALYKTAKKLNSQRSIFSFIVNWAENYRNYKAMQMIKDSLMQDNNMSKKEMKALLDFACKDGMGKYTDFAGLDRNGKPMQEKEGKMIDLEELHEEQEAETYRENYQEVQDKLDQQLSDDFDKEDSKDNDGPEKENESNLEQGEKENEEVAENSQDLSESLY